MAEPGDAATRRTVRAGRTDTRLSVDAGWLAIRWLHVLAMALFVGGQLVLVVAGSRSRTARCRSARTPLARTAADAPA